MNFKLSFRASLMGVLFLCPSRRWTGDHSRTGISGTVYATDVKQRHKTLQKQQNPPSTDNAKRPPGHRDNGTGGRTFYWLATRCRLPLDHPERSPYNAKLTCRSGGMVDTSVSKTDAFRACRFESGLRYQVTIQSRPVTPREPA